MPLVLGLADVAVALVACILLYATYNLWRPLLVGALSQLPYVGGWLADRVDSLLYSILVAAVAPAQVAIGPLVDLFTRVVGVLQTLGGDISNTFGATYNWMVATMATLHQLHDDYIGWARWALAQAVAELDAYRAQVAAWQQFAADDWRGWARWALATALAELTAFKAQVAAWEQFAADDWRGWARWAEQAAAGAAADLVNKLGAELVAELGRLEAWAAGRLDQVEGEARAIGAQAERELGAARSELGSQIDARTAATAAAAAAATAAVATRVKSLEDSNCQQECLTLGGLGAELDLLEFGLILGLVAVIAHDPKGAARVLVQDVMPAARETAGALRSLV